jgi:hypothetical protein
MGYRTVDDDRTNADADSNRRLTTEGAGRTKLFHKRRRKAAIFLRPSKITG